MATTEELMAGLTKLGEGIDQLNAPDDAWDARAARLAAITTALASPSRDAAVALLGAPVEVPEGYANHESAPRVTVPLLPRNMTAAQCRAWVLLLDRAADEAEAEAEEWAAEAKRAALDSVSVGGP